LSDNLIDRLKEIGLNTYEARVYLALLRHSPATGYEISKESGVPQSRAYDTLKALEANNVVVALDGKPITYVPICPTELLNRWERSVKGSLDYLRDTLPKLSHEAADPVMTLRGEELMFQQVTDMIRRAEKKLFIQIWSQDTDRVAPCLSDARARGVIIRLVGYNDCQLENVVVFDHRFHETIEKTYGFRWLCISRDDEEGLIATIPMDGRPPQALISRNLGLVLLIKEFVGHDILVLDMEKHFPEHMTELYGKDTAALRDRIQASTHQISLAKQPVEIQKRKGKHFFYEGHH